MDDESDRSDNTSLCLLGFIDGLTGALVLATIAGVYALVIDAWT